MSSKRSTSTLARILVDTSFLLPAVGLDVEEEVYDAIKCFHKVVVCYIEASILEIMWKVVKIVPESEMNIVRMGIEAIRSTYTLLTPGASALLESYVLYRRFHRDLIDNLLYAVSNEYKIPLLTIDRKFIQTLEMNGRDTSNILTPEKFVKALKSN
ncbi:PIN domain-containing protein [Candidatus Bathyarchaeota archaeon]|nr:PIN domain-containing protein [Candidatus Bathyarchaeota archaeon]MBS7618518.1 PIN domain-containing protein [Candidatus Bathyarchaeota archaeon]